MTRIPQFLDLLSDAFQAARDAYGASRSFLEAMPYGFPWFTPEESARISAYHDELAAKYGAREYNEFGELQAGIRGSYDDQWYDQKAVYDAEVAAGMGPRQHWPFNFNDED
jgi:hypothetical protein